MQENLNEKYAAVLKNLSIADFNAMQKSVIERSTEVDNLMLLAPTGTGKTLAYLIPVINTLKNTHQGLQALIIAPSRELSLQIEEVFRSMKTSFKVSCFYGGHSMKTEQNSLSDTPAVIIGTPGRLADHVERHSFDLSSVKIVVLDEFDKSLQMGFHDQLKIIFKALSGKQKHLLTSATNPDSLPDFLPFRRIETLNHLQSDEPIKLSLKLVHTKSTEKVETLMRLVAGFNDEVCLIFCNHRDAVERISTLFKMNNFEHGIFHGALEQIDREKNLIKFRGGAHHVFIATDLAARGLDIPEIRHVVHYQLPQSHEAFIHRNGRTARMHAAGEAYLILADDESLPDYIDPSTQVIRVNPKLQLPPPPKFVCLYISAGKKDKISKGDIAGLLIKKGGLLVDDIGLITTLDHASYVSVKREGVKKVLSAIKDERLKKMKVKIEIAS
ncbi:MAG: DEAD/DEAH box helicase [Cyclobacteriaceae bacterium]